MQENIICNIRSLLILEILEENKMFRENELEFDDDDLPVYDISVEE